MMRSLFQRRHSQPFMLARRLCSVMSPPTLGASTATLLEAYLKDRAVKGVVPAAVISVDLYGWTPDYVRLQQICDKYSVLIVEAAAEALGSSRRGQMAGTFSLLGGLSFSVNKITTTGGGGALLGPPLS